MTIYDILWTGWVLAFAVIEGAAIRHDHREASSGPRSRRRRTAPRRRAISAHLRRWFSAWFVPHIGGF